MSRFASRIDAAAPAAIRSRTSGRGCSRARICLSCLVALSWWCSPSSAQQGTDLDRIPPPPPLVPAAVPASVPDGIDPGSVPAVPIFGPHSPTATSENLPPPPPDIPAVPGTATADTTDDRIPPPPPANDLTDKKRTKVPAVVRNRGSSGNGSSNSGTGLRESDINAYVVPEDDLTPVQTEAGGVIWERNAPLAFHKAKILQRPLLLLFTASWDNRCQMLSKEVFASKTFNNFAKENCVICFVDYPRNINHATDSMRRVKDKFNVRGYPSMLIFDPDGNVVQQLTGYREGRPLSYYNELYSVVDPLCIHLKSRKKKLMNQGYRDWTDLRGTTVFGSFVSHNGEKAMLRGPAGDRWIFPIATLAPDDQALVRSFPTFAELHPQQAAGTGNQPR